METKNASKKRKADTPAAKKTAKKAAKAIKSDSADVQDYSSMKVSNWLGLMSLVAARD